ncbi:hypothetical protein Dvina_15360 [Dactylosporangium vinaceum]|uniref:Uncharacterized protein n=1 Tax=Dactylosporangium vinaceum TaxID=53362 RepID=A0ABV5M264_9ACTN|nr:hypothetical protein [Dactylosporangium vinaceum]UAB99330.1 hypothetical protein Dvina_15360 [Dactylosporangium vinaceum]
MVAALAAAAALVPAGVAHAAADPVPQSAKRAMWLWSRAAPAAVVAWAEQHGVKEIFAAVPWAPTTADASRLRDLRARTKAAGIRLSALGGDPAWAVNPKDAVAWRQRVSAMKLFDGVHLDVEPYLLPNWVQDQQRIAASYLTMLDAVRRAGPEPLEADVPFWLATVKVGAQNLAEAVIQRVDAITVMSYRDSGAAVLDVGTDLLARARKSRLPVRLAAETQPSADCAYCTFAGRTQSALRQQLAAIDTGAKPYPTYQGIAVHDYDSWSRIS